MSSLHHDRLFWFVLLGIYIAWFVASLSWPFGIDQGILAWVGWGILQGHLPYRDLWDVKGPGAYYAFALVEWLFGHNMWGIRVFDALLQLIGIGAVTYSAKAIGDNRTGVIAGSLGMLLYMTRGWWNTAQPDGWMGILFAVAVALLEVGLRRVSIARIALASFCIGLCATVKPNYALLLLILASSLILYRRSTHLFRAVSAACLGFAIPLIVTVVWFAMRGGIKDLYAVLFAFNAKVYMLTSQLSLSGHLTNVYYIVSDPAVSLCLVVSLFGTYQLYNRNLHAFTTIMLWFGAVAACIAIQAHYYLYQFSPLYQPIAILSAIGIRSLDLVARPETRDDTRPFRVFPSTIILWCLMSFFSVNIYHYFHDWAKLKLGKITSSEYASHFQGFGRSDSFDTVQSVSNYVMSRTQPGDMVEVWGWDPLINFLSHRPSPTRFGYIYPLQIPNPFKERYRSEFLRRIIANSPKYILAGC